MSFLPLTWTELTRKHTLFSRAHPWCSLSLYALNKGHGAAEAFQAPALDQADVGLLMAHLRRWLPTLRAHSDDLFADELGISYAASWLVCLQQDLSMPTAGASKRQRYSLIVRLCCHVLLMYLRCWDDVVAVAHALVRAVFPNTFGGMTSDWLANKLPNPAHMGRRAVAFDMAVALVHRQHNVNMRRLGAEKPQLGGG